MNIFKINKCKKFFFEKFPFFGGGHPYKKNNFLVTIFSRVSGKIKTFLKKKKFFFFFFWCTESIYSKKKSKKNPGSWHFGSRLNFGKLKTWRSPIFEILIFKAVLKIRWISNKLYARFPKPPKVTVSWNFDFRPNLGQIKTWRSPIFEILIFKSGPHMVNHGIFVFFSYTNSKMMCLFTISSTIKHHSYLTFWI